MIINRPWELVPQRSGYPFPQDWGSLILANNLTGKGM